MAVFLEVMVFVFGGLLIVFLLVAAVFAMLATPKKRQPLEDKHKAAKKKSNICALIAGGCIVLGVGCGFLNHVIIQNERKEAANTQLFGDNDKSQNSSKPATSSSMVTDISSKPLENSSIPQSPDSISSPVLTTIQKLDFMDECRKKLTYGDVIEQSQISLLRSTVDDVVIQLIASIKGNTGGILGGLLGSTKGLDSDTLTSLTDGLSGFAAETVKSYIESHKFIADYLTKLENGDSTTSEEAAQCANELGYLSAMARTDLD